MMKKKMLMRFVGLAAANMLLLLGGCVASPHYAMQPEAAQKINEVDVFVGLDQHEIKPTIEVSTGGAGFGLIGALVDANVNNSRTEGAEQRISPLRNALIDFDFESHMQSQVGDALTTLTWFGEEKPPVINGSLEENYSRELKVAESDALLFLTTEYRTSPDFSAIEVFVRASMFPVADGLNDFRASTQRRNGKYSAKPEDAIYRNDIKAVARMKDGAGNSAYNLMRWAQDDGKLAREALTRIIERAASMVALDVLEVEGSVAGVEGSKPVALDKNAIGTTLKGRAAYEDDGATIYRYTNGGLVSFIELTP